MTGTPRRTPTRNRAARPSEFSGWEDWYRRSDYRSMPWYSPRPSPWLVRAVRRNWFSPGARVLDVGCGTGTNALWLGRRGFRTAGLDVAATAIAVASDRARSAGVEVDLRVGSVTDLPWPRGRFGGGVDNGCFHSLPLDARAAYARELSRVLRPGAPLLLTWIPREVQNEFGPPHRPSLTEVATVLEPTFVFRDVEWRASGTPEAWKVRTTRVARCTALLIRRAGTTPPAR